MISPISILLIRRAEDLVRRYGMLVAFVVALLVLGNLIATSAAVLLWPSLAKLAADLFGIPPATLALLAWVGLANAVLILCLFIYFYLNRAPTVATAASGAREPSAGPGPATQPGAAGNAEPEVPPGPMVIESVSIKNFKNIRSIDLDLVGQPRLEGNWTCIAGVNGAGKSSILQAICLLLLGERSVPELGRQRLRRMLREEAGAILTAELRARCRIGSRTFTLYLPLAEDGVDEAMLRQHEDYPFMSFIWRNIPKQMVVSYGAARNISDRRETRNNSLSKPVQRQMTLFDPLSQIASIEALIEGFDAASRRSLRTVELLLKAVIQEAGSADSGRQNRLVFARDGASLGPLELPDGFRSSVAWLADICVTWHETGGSGSRSVNPRDITGIVLLDEIDLHLHARLQREIVPRLRTELPNVQFIVTTHSPMILANFHRNELIVLDRREDGGIRHLDRELFALTMDEIYDWLMDTKPESKVISEMMKTGDPKLAALMYQSKDTNAEEAAAELRQAEEWLASLKSSTPDPT